MDEGVTVLQPNPYAAYEDAARDYIEKFRALMELPGWTGVAADLVSVELPVDILIRHAEKIAHVSSCMIQIAESQLESASAMVREGFLGHFIDQAAAEFLLGTELLRICKRETGAPSAAAECATYGAALRECAGVLEISLSASVSQGIPAGESHWAMEYATAEEAASALGLAIAGATGNMIRKVQELGKDIAFDLVTGGPVIKSEDESRISREEITRILDSVAVGSIPVCSGALSAAERILANAYGKIIALLDRESEPEARSKVTEWLVCIQQAGKTELFDSLVESFFGAEELKWEVKVGKEESRFKLESINRTSILIKSFSEKFTILTNRMRKLEDAIRLGKRIQIPRFFRITTAMQFALLMALVFAGRDSIHRGLAGILRARGFLSDVYRPIT